jgi:hypothetical protein
VNSPIAQLLDAYRRLSPFMSAPTNVRSGYDNRTCGVRIPKSAAPAMTNIGMVLPEPRFWESPQKCIRRHGSALVIDETHTISCGPGGYTRARGLQPDAVVIGKGVGGGLACAA